MACLEDEYRCQGCLSRSCRCRVVARSRAALEERLRTLLGVKEVYLSSEGGWLTIRLKDDDCFY